MGFGTNIMKTLMFVFNAIVWILGIVLFVIGIVVLAEGKNWNDIIDGKTVPVSVMLIVVGLVIAIVGFLGCCGAMKQNGTMLLIYAIILGFIIIIQLIAGILAFIYSDEAEEVIKKNADQFLKDYDGISKTSHSLNVIMEEMECCGVNGQRDFKTKTNDEKWNQQNIPDSCCKNMVDECGWEYETKSPTIYYSEGCVDKVVTFFRENFKLAGICGLVFVIIEIIQIILALVLRRNADGVIA